MVEALVTFLLHAAILVAGCVMSYNTGYNDGWNCSLETMEEEVREAHERGEL
jgi:hypothetical protein